MSEVRHGTFSPPTRPPPQCFDPATRVPIASLLSRLHSVVLCYAGGRWTTFRSYDFFEFTSLEWCFYRWCPPSRFSSSSHTGKIVFLAPLSFLRPTRHAGFPLPSGTLLPTFLVRPCTRSFFLAFLFLVRSHPGCFWLFCVCRSFIFFQNHRPGCAPHNASSFFFCLPPPLVVFFVMIAVSPFFSCPFFSGLFESPVLPPHRVYVFFPPQRFSFCPAFRTYIYFFLRFLRHPLLFGVDLWRWS